jgi:hypothetical protein
MPAKGQQQEADKLSSRTQEFLARLDARGKSRMEFFKNETPALRESRKLWELHSLRQGLSDGQDKMDEIVATTSP